ncbi:hypothetical protein R8510_02909 [Ralstonia chuxiongensis]|nr:hypothetical protein R8510_02909 [Ralstonia chuxiongensis]
MKRCAADIVNEMKRKPRFLCTYESELNRYSGVKEQDRGAATSAGSSRAPAKPLRREPSSRYEARAVSHWFGCSGAPTIRISPRLPKNPLPMLPPYCAQPIAICCVLAT